MTDEAYLAVLGLAPGASREDVKSAYRRVARENHPDRNPNDPDAAERFRSATEAYRNLTAEGAEPLQEPTPPSRSSATEIFDKVFAKAKSTLSKQRGADLKYTLRLEFMEAARGGEKVIRVPREATCRRCDGSGAEPGSTFAICPVCDGEGTVGRKIGFFERNETCSECGGSGRIPSESCVQCGGRGVVAVDEEITLKLAPGVAAGTRLRVAGEGQPGTEGGEPGDLFVVIEVSSHPFFARDGDDLLVTAPIPFVVAAAGGHVTIPTLDGVVRMRIPAGSPSGRVFRLQGKGFSGGDQRVTVVIDVPEVSDDGAKAALQVYAERESALGLIPRVAAFEQAVSSFENE